MRFKSALFSLVLLAGFTVPLAAQKKVDRSALPRVAVLEFPAAKGAYVGWTGFHGISSPEAKISDVLADLFTTAFVQEGKGKIRVIERQRIQEIRAEQNFQTSGEVDTATVVKLGKLLGVKYMITGKVTRFAYKGSTVKTGWGVGALVGKITKDPMAGAVAGSVNIQKASFNGRLDVRIIDVQTGEILDSQSEENKVDDTAVKVAGTGVEIQYDDELVNKVFEPVVQKLASKLIQSILSEHS